MAVYAKINSSADIINGCAVVSGLGVGSGLVLDNRQRDIHFANLDNLNLATELNSRYHVGGSGGWERPSGPIQ